MGALAAGDARTAGTGARRDAVVLTPPMISNSVWT